MTFLHRPHGGGVQRNRAAVVFSFIVDTDMEIACVVLSVSVLAAMLFIACDCQDVSDSDVDL